MTKPAATFLQLVGGTVMVVGVSTGSWLAIGAGLVALVIGGVAIRERISADQRGDHGAS